MTTNELQTISGGYGIVPTCFFPADLDRSLRPTRREDVEPTVVAVSLVFPVCLG